jgi:hypothetical protein
MGTEIAGGIATAVMVFLIHAGKRYAQVLLFRSAGIPAEFSDWVTNFILGSRSIAPTKEEIILFNTTLIPASILQWALIGIV